VAKPRLQAIYPRCGRSPHRVNLKNPHVERVFNPDGKDPHRGRRKLGRDR
jgi:hypothetical protein